ncbi:tRNA pseudouridine(13) synthase TruD [Candidatus Bathyarchaeota archaeon]|nr:tRNA pseudouridine(13) synthase TruD [Candidatus Bathyarchaeota archaeon]
MKIEMPGAEGFLTEAEGIPLKVNRFEVFEVPKFIPTGQGAHMWGLLEKTNRTTLGVVREISTWSGIDARDIGYAGLKDKKGRTLQWISSPGELPPAGRGFRISVTRNSGRKIKRGNLLGNWFRVGVVADLPRLRPVLKELQSRGIPNFFGPQRFSTNNHEIGELLVKGKKKEARKLMEASKIPFTRRHYVLLEDAYCSYLFNKVLSERLGATLPGDVLSRFGPAGPIFGKKLGLASGAAGEIEMRILSSTGLALKDFPGGGKRRPFNVPLKGLRYSQGTLRFFLPKGSYATVVLREIAKENAVTWLPLTSSSSCV